MMRLVISIVCVIVLMVIVYTDGKYKGRRDGYTDGYAQGRHDEMWANRGLSPVFDQLAKDMGITFKSPDLQVEPDYSTLDRLDGLDSIRKTS